MAAAVGAATVLSPLSLKPKKLKLNDEERLFDSALVTLTRAGYTHKDIAEGQGVETEFLYEQVQGKLRRTIHPKILLVMRNRAIAGFFAQCLIRRGCEVIVCTNGHKAYTSYLRKNAHEFSLCLCQWYLPGIAGRDLAYYEAESGGRLPFVALLGSGQRATDAIRSGADLFLKLPIFPHLRTILSLVLPHSSAMAQIKVGAMVSNADGLRRLLGSQQDVVRHSVETTQLAELVKQDLSVVTEISSLEVGIGMLDAIMVGLRQQTAAQNSHAPGGSDASSDAGSPLRHKLKSNVASSAMKRTKSYSRVAAAAEEALQRNSELTAARESQHRTVAQSFRNLMIVFNKTRTALITAQEENHQLRQDHERALEHIDYVKGQLRSMGVDVQEAKLEQLYLPRSLTRSPPPALAENASIPRSNSSVVALGEEKFHEVVARDTNEVDVAPFSKLDLLRALRAAKAAIRSSNEEVVELTEQLRRLHDYQMEVEEDVAGTGMAVHFHLGGPASPLQQKEEVSFPPISVSGAGASKLAEEAVAALSANQRKKSMKALTRSSNGSDEDSQQQHLTLQQRITKNIAMLSPRMQEEFLRQQQQEEDELLKASSQSRGGGGNKTMTLSASGVSPHVPRSPANHDSMLFTAAVSGGLAGSAAKVRGETSIVVEDPRLQVSRSSPEHILQRRQSRQDHEARKAFVQQFAWISHINRSLEKSMLAAEDTRAAAAGRVKPVVPVPRCAEKPRDVVADAFDVLVNGLIELHNSVAANVNTATARISALFPSSHSTLIQLSTAVRNDLIKFDVVQSVNALHLHIEGRILKALSAERDAWAKERVEMEKYKLQNPPGARKTIAELKATVRDCRMRRWRDWFQSVEAKVQANYLRKWLLWFVGKKSERKWADSVKQIETEVHATTMKRIAEQQNFARRQSTDVLAKQSQQKIEYEALLSKYNRVTSLHDDSKKQATMLKRENEQLENQVADLKNKKVCLDEIVRDKSEMILELTQAQQPLVDEVASLKAALADRDQKSQMLTAQVGVLQKKLRVAGPSTGVATAFKSCQTAISNANCKAQLDGVLLSRNSMTNSMKQLIPAVGASVPPAATVGGVDLSTTTSGDMMFDFAGEQVLADDGPLGPDRNSATSSPASTTGDSEGLIQPLLPQKQKKEKEQKQPKDALKAQTGRRSRSVSHMSTSNKRSPSTSHLAVPGPHQTAKPAGKSPSVASLSATPRRDDRSDAFFEEQRISRSATLPALTLEQLAATMSPTDATSAVVSTGHVTPLGGDVGRPSPTPPPIPQFFTVSGEIISSPTPPPADASPVVVHYEQQVGDTGVPGSTRSSFRGGSTKTGVAIASNKQKRGSTQLQVVRPTPVSSSMASSRKRSVSLTGDPSAVPTGSSRQVSQNTSNASPQGVDSVQSTGTDELPALWSPEHSALDNTSFATHRPVETCDRSTSALAVIQPVLETRDVQAVADVRSAQCSPLSVPLVDQALQTVFQAAVRKPIVRDGIVQSDEPELSDTACGASLRGDIDASMDVPDAETDDAKLEGSSYSGVAAARRKSALTFAGDDASSSGPAPPNVQGSSSSASSASQQSSRIVEYADTSTWQSALRDLRRKSSSTASSASPRAADAGVAELVDSARKLFELMNIPQNVLVKSTDSADMVDQLKYVFDAASIVVKKRTAAAATQQQQQAASSPTVAVGGSTKENRRTSLASSTVSPVQPSIQPPLVKSTSGKTSGLAMQPDSGSISAWQDATAGQTVSPPFSAGVTATEDAADSPKRLALPPIPNAQGQAGNQQRRPQCDESKPPLPLIGSPRKQARVVVDVGQRGKATTSSYDSANGLAVMPRHNDGSQRAKSVDDHNHAYERDTVSDHRRHLQRAGGESGAQSTSLQPCIENERQQRSPSPPHLSPKDIEKERASVRVNVATSLMQHMLQHPPQREHHQDVGLSSPPHPPPPHANRSTSKSSGGQFLRSLR